MVESCYIRKDIRLTIFYKIVNEISNVPNEGILIEQETNMDINFEYPPKIQMNTNTPVELSAKSSSWQ